MDRQTGMLPGRQTLHKEKEREMVIERGMRHGVADLISISNDYFNDDKFPLFGMFAVLCAMSACTRTR